MLIQSKANAYEFRANAYKCLRANTYKCLFNQRLMPTNLGLMPTSAYSKPLIGYNCRRPVGSPVDRLPENRSPVVFALLSLDDPFVCRGPHFELAFGKLKCILLVKNISPSLLLVSGVRDH